MVSGRYFCALGSLMLVNRSPARAATSVNTTGDCALRGPPTEEAVSCSMRHETVATMRSRGICASPSRTCTDRLGCAAVGAERLLLALQESRACSDAVIGAA